MTTRQVYGRGPIVTGRTAIQPASDNAAHIAWLSPLIDDQIRVTASASPTTEEEYELCTSVRAGTARIRRRIYSAFEVIECKETAAVDEHIVRALWADLLAGRAR